MSVPLEYVVIEDAVMLMSAPPPTIILNVNEVVPISVPANGATWRVQSNQEPNHPGMSMPALSIEGCAVPGTVFSTGFMNQLPPDDADYWKDIDCTENRGAYDPNDKQVWPGDHITPVDVAAGVPLRYTIRFQNTGTYLAERVRLVDTLDADLDLATLSVLGASHPFSWQIKDGHVLEILFDQILLPDSNSNEAASHGFFSFSIAAKRTLPIGTPLLNQAAIYFDYNSPIFTNTTYTQVSFESAVSNPANPSLFLRIFPNPVSTKCTVQTPSPSGTLTLYNAAGILLQVWPDCPEQIEVNMPRVVNGLYYFRWEKGRDFVIKAVVVGR